MNINELMKQAQVMQKKMQEAQAEIASKEYIGKSGGGLVTISMSGKGEMLKVAVDSSLLNVQEKEMLEDLIVAAHNDAKAKADKDSASSMSHMLGDFGKLPSGMKF